LKLYTYTSQTLTPLSISPTNYLLNQYPLKLPKFVDVPQGY
jgi:hypothetical protein